VLGQERLFSILSAELAKEGRGIEVVKLTKSGGVVPRDSLHRKKSRHARFRDYFYGSDDRLAPHAASAAFTELQVFKVGGGPQAPRSALPIGAQPAADPTRVVPVAITRELEHAVLAVSYAKEPSEVLSSNVAGYLYVTNVDTTRMRVRYLAPMPGPLPSPILLMGSLQWIE